MYWNLRLVYDTSLNQVGLKEVHYNEKTNKIESWSMGFMDPKSYQQGKTKNMQALYMAFSKPVLILENGKLRELKPDPKSIDINNYKL